MTPITKDFGTPTTADDVTKAVTVPDYPSSKGTPTVTVDNPSTLPDGHTPGAHSVPVTVTYPDGSKTHMDVPVTVKEQPDKDKYEPSTKAILNHLVRQRQQTKLKSSDSTKLSK